MKFGEEGRNFCHDLYCTSLWAPDPSSVPRGTRKVPVLHFSERTGFQ
jgi:hypothetical protein